jgi:hypothetical protein
MARQLGYSPPVYTSCIAGMTGVSYHIQLLLVEMGSWELPLPWTGHRLQWFHSLPHELLGLQVWTTTPGSNSVLMTGRNSVYEWARHFFLSKPPHFFNYSQKDRSILLIQTDSLFLFYQVGLPHLHLFFIAGTFIVLSFVTLFSYSIFILAPYLKFFFFFFAVWSVLSFFCLMSKLGYG